MKIIAGIDEVGRGSLVVLFMPQVIFYKSINRKLLKDSKVYQKQKEKYYQNMLKKILFGL